MPSNVWPKNNNNEFKCSRLLEGDGIKSRLPFKNFSTLSKDYEKARFDDPLGPLQFTIASMSCLGS